MPERLTEFKSVPKAIQNCQWKILWLLLVGTFVLLGQPKLWAQQKGQPKPSPKKAASQNTTSTRKLPPPEEKVLRASDGWPIFITYFPSPAGKESPVVVLLHMKGSSSLAWLRENGGFAKLLQKSGYAVVAVDLRKHGKSRVSQKRPRGRAAKSLEKLTRLDYLAMVERDLEAVKGFIYREHQNQHLNMRKSAIIAAEFSCPIAINYTALDWLKPPFDDAPTPEAKTPRGQDIQALILLSPDLSCPGVVTPKAIRLIRQWPIFVLICTGADDEQYVKNAVQLYRLLGGAGHRPKRVFLNKFPGKLRGTDMLNEPKLNVEKVMLGFLNKYVKSLQGPRYRWRDRRSRLLK